MDNWVGDTGPAWCQAARVDEPEAHDDEHRERHEFGDCEQIDDERALSDASEVDPTEGQHDACNHRRSATPVVMTGQ